MIVFLKSDGTVAYQSDENINLGSNKANKLTVVAPFAPSSVVTAYITLPNGVTLDPVFLDNKGDAIKVVEDGENLSVWETEIEACITRISGYLKIQLYIDTDGATLTSSLIIEEVNVGVKNVTKPSAPEQGIYEEIKEYLGGSMNYIEGQKQDAEKWATGSNVTSEDPQFNNNAKYYASEASASASSATGSATSANEAQQAAEAAASSSAASEENAKASEENAKASEIVARTSASAAQNYLTELKSGIVEPLKKRVDNIDYILEQFGAIIEERDSSSALVKSVPARSDMYAYLSEIGGRTESFNQKLILPTFDNSSFSGVSTYFWQLAEGGSGTDSDETTAVIKNGVTVINNGDGSFTLRGTATAYDSIELFSVYNSKASFSYIEKVQIFGIDITKDSYLSFGGASLPAGVLVRVVKSDEDDNTVFMNEITGDGGEVTGSTLCKYLSSITLEAPSGTVFNNLTIKLMLNDGTSAMPWQSPNEPFEGLRSAKVKEIKSYGENLFNAYNLVDNNKAYPTVVNQTTFAVTFNNIRYRIFSPKAGRYYFSAQSKRTGTKGGGVAAVIYNKAGNIVEPAKYWRESDLNPNFEFVLDGTEYELRIIFYGSLSDSVEETAIFKNVSLLLNTPTLIPTVSEIPASIQNLPNYGEGNPNDPTEYNAVDGENGVYIRRGGIDNGSWVSETTTTTPINFDPLIPIEASGSIEIVNDNNQEVPTTFVYNIIQEA